MTLTYHWYKYRILGEITLIDESPFFRYLNFDWTEYHREHMKLVRNITEHFQLYANETSKWCHLVGRIVFVISSPITRYFWIVDISLGSFVIVIWVQDVSVSVSIIATCVFQLSNNWFTQFKSDLQTVEDNPRPRRSSTSTNDAFRKLWIWNMKTTA